MKRALAILLTTFCAAIQAQPIYRCQNALGNVAYQDRLCTETRQGSNDHAELDRPKQPLHAPNNWNHRQRHLDSVLRAHQETLRLQTALSPLSDPRKAEYADNRRRCERAMRITELCGKFAGDFSCDEKGFHHDPVTDISTLKTAAVDNGDVYHIEQCALRAANGGL